MYRKIKSLNTSLWTQPGIKYTNLNLHWQFLFHTLISYFKKTIFIKQICTNSPALYYFFLVLNSRSLQSSLSLKTNTKLKVHFHYLLHMDWMISRSLNNSHVFQMLPIGSPNHRLWDILVQIVVCPSTVFILWKFFGLGIFKSSLA